VSRYFRRYRLTKDHCRHRWANHIGPRETEAEADAGTKAAKEIAAVSAAVNRAGTVLAVIGEERAAVNGRGGYGMIAVRKRPLEHQQQKGPTESSSLRAENPTDDSGDDEDDSGDDDDDRVSAVA
jgi:hypothetical protein